MADGTNLYWYASGNPVILIDPAGTTPKTLSTKEVGALKTEINVLKGDLAAHDHALGQIARDQAVNDKAIIESQARQVSFKGNSNLVASEQGVEHKARLNKKVLADKYSAEVASRNRVEARLIEAQAKMEAHNAAVAETRAEAKLQTEAWQEMEAALPPPPKHFNGEKYTTAELQAALQDATDAANGDPNAAHELFDKKLAELEARSQPASARPPPETPPPEAPASEAAPVRVEVRVRVQVPVDPPLAPDEVEVDLSELEVAVLPAARSWGPARWGSVRSFSTSEGFT